MLRRINQIRKHGIGYMTMLTIRHVRGVYFAARFVNPRWNFVIREVPIRFFSPKGRRKVLQTYEIYGKNPVLIDQSMSSLDSSTLFEIFVDQQYGIPRQVQPSLCARPLRILDIGGNVGYFALWAHINLPDSALTGVEADPQNAERYEETLRLLRREDWRLVRAFASSHPGSVRFSAGKSVFSGRSKDGSGIEIPSVDVFPYIEEADLIKMDIEGGEWEILSDPRFSRLQQKAIVLEYHSDFCPAPDPRAEVLRIAYEGGFNVAEGMHSGRVLWLYKP